MVPLPAAPFFARFLEKDYWSRLQPERGSFRAYLKRALQHFLVNAKRDAAVRRPEGGLFSIDALPAELEALGASATETPEQAYDREWFAGLLDASFEELRALLARDGKTLYYDIFRAYCLEEGGGGAAPTYRSPPYRGWISGRSRSAARARPSPSRAGAWDGPSPPRRSR